MITGGHIPVNNWKSNINLRIALPDTTVVDPLEQNPCQTREEDTS